jgi:hypothetical protein
MIADHWKAERLRRLRSIFPGRNTARWHDTLVVGLRTFGDVGYIRTSSKITFFALRAAVEFKKP